MAWLALTALIVWPVATIFIFEAYPPRSAIVIAFVVAWLFLPPTIIMLPGVPDWSKTTATVVSVTVVLWFKHARQFLAIRLRWFDIPVLAFTGCSLASSLSAGQGVYEGLSSVLEEILRWALPYLIGRAFLNDTQGLRQLTLGLAVGGICYMPLCWFELKMSPILKNWVYAFSTFTIDNYGLRYGGYRPMVFLTTGLELGWWMCCATLAAFLLWRSGSVRYLFGMPFGVLTTVLALTTIACKSTGALVQIALGFALIYACRWTRTTILIWGLLLVGPMYCLARPTGFWTGEQLLGYANMVFDADRTQSLGFRFEQEEILLQAGTQRPIFGWSRNGGFNPMDEKGNTAAITDGFWIIVFCSNGAFGLVAFNAMLLVPTTLFLRRYPPRTWIDPEVAPLTTFAIILPLYMIDNLSNAMPNPIYAIAMGSCASCLAGPVVSGRRRAESLPTYVAQDHPELAQASAGSSRGEGAVGWLQRQAWAAWERNQLDEAIPLQRRAVRAQQSDADLAPTPDRIDRLARLHISLARLLAAAGDHVGALVERQRADVLWRSVYAAVVADPEATQHFADHANDLAWLLLASPDLDMTSLEKALELVDEAVRLVPESAPYWNTLGIARHRRGRYLQAIQALSRSVHLHPDGGTAFDFFYLALANQALGQTGPAESWLARAEMWLLAHPDAAPALAETRAEIAACFPASRFV